jgi:hypothetical protein
MRATVALTLAFSVAGCTSEQERIANTFRYFPTLAERASKASSIAVYEGLPSPQFEPKLFEKERQRPDAVELNGHYFYRDAVNLETDDVERLRVLCTERSLWRPWGGPKSCGGFHPDWRLVWKDAGSRFTVDFCFGCSEVKVYVDDALRMHCEMNDEGAFKSALNRLRTNRPLGPFNSTNAREE